MPNDNKRKRRIRQRMYKKQKGLCWICGERMAISVGAAGSGKYASFDHLVPKADGGGNVQSNLRLAHKRCNSARGDLSILHVLLVRDASTENEHQP